MSRARDMANLGAQAGSGLDASDITTGTLGNTVQDNITRLGAVTQGSIGSAVTGNWGLRLLETKTISGTPTTFDMGSASIFSSTYDTYKIIFNDLMFNDDSNLYLRFIVADTGLVDSSDYDYSAKGFSANNDSSQASSDISSILQINSFTIKGVNTAIQGACGEIIIPNPSNATSAKFIYGRIAYLNSSAFTSMTIFSGGLAQDAENAHQKAVTGIRFGQHSDHTYTRGTLRLYGVINA